VLGLHIRGRVKQICEGNERERGATKTGLVDAVIHTGRFALVDAVTRTGRFARKH
jgi:hypothetical protein